MSKQQDIPKIPRNHNQYNQLQQQRSQEQQKMYLGKAKTDEQLAEYKKKQSINYHQGTHKPTPTPTVDIEKSYKKSAEAIDSDSDQELGGIWQTNNKTPRIESIGKVNGGRGRGRGRGGDNISEEAKKEKKAKSQIKGPTDLSSRSGNSQNAGKASKQSMNENIVQYATKDQIGSKRKVKGMENESLVIEISDSSDSEDQKEEVLKLNHTKETLEVDKFLASAVKFNSTKKTGLSVI